MEQSTSLVIRALSFAGVKLHPRKLSLRLKTSYSGSNLNLKIPPCNIDFSLRLHPDSLMPRVNFLRLARGSRDTNRDEV